MSKKVFLSHASEDKKRFVTNFAARLRDNGIDAWLDKWEMLPGDSLVDKIFEEGLKEADAVIIILSKFSVDKPWVREELNTSVVKKVTKGTKIIPVVLDDCDVPEALTSTLWENINDLESYDKSFKRIISSILGLTDKPPLGSPPAYTATIDKIVSAIVNENIDTNIKLQNKLKEPIYLINRTLELLKLNGHIDLTKAIGGTFLITKVYVSLRRALNNT